MNLKINSRHVEVTPAMRSHLEAGLAKIRKHFDHVLDASAFLIVDNAKEKIFVKRPRSPFTSKVRSSLLKRITLISTTLWMRWLINLNVK